MKKEDRLEACESLQEIETDLTFWLIESYERREINDIIILLSIIRPILDIHKELCSENMK